VVPPLRERHDDIPLLVHHFINEACSFNGLELKKVDEELMQLFKQFDWPGNVRQLKNLVERMVVLSEGDVMSIEDAPDFIQGKSSPQQVYDVEYEYPLKHAKENFEKHYIMNVLQNNDWNISRSARILEIERTYLHRKIKAYGIEKN